MVWNDAVKEVYFLFLNESDQWKTNKNISAVVAESRVFINVAYYLVIYTVDIFNWTSHLIIYTRIIGKCSSCAFFEQQQLGACNVLAHEIQKNNVQRYFVDGREKIQNRNAHTANVERELLFRFIQSTIIVGGVILLQIFYTCADICIKISGNYGSLYEKSLNYM